jgi:serine/threonine protein kinase/tetratricopeptide (TPR) repeat protein
VADKIEHNLHRIKRYRFDEKILGQGGMGVVYSAIDRLTGRAVAFKQVKISVSNLDFAARPSVAESQKKVLAALSREFRVLASLRHPYIISVHDYGFDNEQHPYFTMDFVRNGRSFLEAGRHLSLDGKIDLLIQLLEALSYLYRRNLVHRDLKPENALVNEAGKIQVLDFGLAIEPEHLRENEVVGTIAYMAPETLQGHPVSMATDLYAVGVMAFELFAGEHPFDTSAIYKLINAILSTEPDFTRLRDHISSSFAIRTHFINPEAVSEITTTAKAESSITQDSADTVAAPTMLLDKDIRASHNSTELTLNALPRETETTKDVTISFATESSKLVRHALTQTEAQNPDDEPALVTVIRRLLSKDLDYRYSDPFQVIQDICIAVERPLPPESSPIRESFLQAARFVGRSDELETLIAAFNMALEDKGSAWLIAGESGVGKSRLIDEFTSYALIEGAIVLHAQAQRDSHSPYHIWQHPLQQLALILDFKPAVASILKLLVPELDQLMEREIKVADSLDASAERQRLNLTIAQLFNQLEQPVVLVLEDLHWAVDELEPLKLIMSQMSQRPFLVLGSFRNDEYPTLPQSLPQTNLLSLQRLKDEEIAELSSSILGKAGWDEKLLSFLQQETEGNVFFIVEIVRSLAEQAGRMAEISELELPQHISTQGINAILDQRLSYVPDVARAVMLLAAVGGYYLDLDVLQAASGQESLDAWLTMSANAALIERQANRWHFAHDKLRERILARMESNESKVLHRRIAEAIETRYPDDSSYAESLANHYRIAEDASKEAHYARIAAEQRYRIGDFIAARALLERSLNALSIDNPSSRMLVLKTMGDVYHALGDYPQAIESFEESHALSLETGSQNITAAVLNSMGRTLTVRGAYEQALASLEAALNTARSNNDSRNQAQAFLYLGNLVFVQDDYPKAEEYYKQSLLLSQEIDDRRYTGMSLSNLASIALEMGQYDLAQERFEKAITIAREIGDRPSQAVNLQNMGIMAQERGDIAGAQTHLEDSLRLAREMHNQFNVAWSLHALGKLLYEQGDFFQAHDYLSDAVALRREMQDHNRLLLSLNYLALVKLHLDEPMEAKSQLQEALRILISIEAWKLLPTLLLSFVCLKLQEGNLLTGTRLIAYLNGLELETQLSFADISLASLHDQYGTVLAETEFDEAETQGAHMQQDEIIARLLED